jgi:hypothetical protein
MEGPFVAAPCLVDARESGMDSKINKGWYLPFRRTNMVREGLVQNKARKSQDLNNSLVGCSPNALSNKSSLVERKCCCFIKFERQRMNFVCCLLEGLTSS